MRKRQKRIMLQLTDGFLLTKGKPDVVYDLDQLDPIFVDHPAFDVPDDGGDNDAGSSIEQRTLGIVRDD